ncbi:MAG: 23S rRNA (guanosine(2251)-2'-O)-methyltransferase RlmB [Gammaproteobacteria bacterium]|nr:23S rRNA (guanosine(2251)-2'-O)-methyltransferase RlmB [Gammaproteobacteria bacterium]
MSENNAIIYGFHAVNSFLMQYPEKIQCLIVDSHRHDARMQEILDLASQHNILIKHSSRKELTSLASHEEHQGVIAMVQSQTMAPDLEDLLDTKDTPFLLVLDGVQDPHNLGACLRTANAAGVDAVIIPKDRAVGITPIVTKVASGATLHTPLYSVTNLARTLRMLKERGIWLFGTSEHATELYSKANLTGSLAIVMGSEGKGLRRLTEENCDILIKIPMQGVVPSLNVSVATGICLFEAVRQKHANKK